MQARPLMIGALLAAGAAIASIAPAAAQDGGIVRGLFNAIGLTPSEKDPIEYRERAPLVVPPKGGLPQPQAPAADRSAAWPNDPDVVARRKEAAERNQPSRTLPWQAEEPRLSPGQLRSGPRTARNAIDDPAARRTNEDDTSKMILQPRMQMGAADARRLESLNNLRPGEEPERKSLSDPPAGYRKPTEIVRTRGEPSRAIGSPNENLGRDYVQDERRRRDAN